MGWVTHFRGLFLIHASLKEDTANVAPVLEGLSEISGRSHAEILDLYDRHGRRGGVVGSAVLTDCVTEHPSGWFVGPYGFLLSDPEPIEFVPLLGRLGFFAIPDWRSP